MATGSVDVATEYAKNKDLKKDDVRMLQEWTEKQPHLPPITELQMIHFLHSCHYRNEAAKTCIETFYTVRAHCPEFFANRNPLEYSSQLLDVLLYTPLPKLTPRGYRVIFSKLIDTDPDKYSLPCQIKSFDMSCSLMLRQEGTSLGHILVVDMKGVSFAHVTKLSVVHLKKFFVYLQDALPVRLKGLYFINIPSFMDKIMALIRPFMKRELLDVLQLYTDNLDAFYQSVPRDCLPEDYGGTAESVAELTEARRKNFLANAAYFVEEEKLVADESRRPGRPKNEGDIFGVEGTFKKLDID